MTDNLASGLKMAKEHAKEPNPYSNEELSRLLAALPPRACGVAVVAVCTGCRKGEIAALRWRHVRFDDNLLRVESTKAYQDRSIALRPEAREVFERLRRERLLVVHGSPIVSLAQAATLDGEPVFGSSADILKPLRRAGRECGITDATQHRLRDTFGTRCFDAGVPAQEVQRLLGHQTMSMTMRYSRVNESYCQKLWIGRPANPGVDGRKEESVSSG